VPTSSHAAAGGHAKPLVLLWLDEADIYLKAADDAGLADRIEFAKVPAAQRPDADLMARADGVLAWNLPAGIIPSLPKLRWIQTMSAGVEAWLRRADLDRRINLTCARGVHREAMPDNIIASIYYVAKPFDAARRQQEASTWKRLVPAPLTGKTLGILGLGTIGADLAHKASVLGLRVIGVKRKPEPVPHVDEVYTLDQLDVVLGRSDFVVLLLPVTPATENLIDARRLSQMKKTGWFFNFARGVLVVDNDLVAATEAGTIAGAVLDVFRSEPLPSEHPFWTAKNIVVLPHVGGSHPQRDKFVAELFVENARRFADGRPLRALVDRDHGY
jgi:phosphoglycerate dehydrogenase-like enzyme